jgi:hypothetical protein
MMDTAAATAADTQQQRNWRRLAHELLVSALRPSIDGSLSHRVRPAGEMQCKTALTRRHLCQYLCPVLVRFAGRSTSKRSSPPGNWRVGIVRRIPSFNGQRTQHCAPS